MSSRHEMLRLMDKAITALRNRLAQNLEMDEAIAAGDGTLHGAIDYWQERALKAEARLAQRIDPAEHDKTCAALLQGERYPCDCKPSAEPVAYRLHKTDIYDFAGWLTTRPGLMLVGSGFDAALMAEAVGEYIRTFPERFTAPQTRKPLTDETLWEMWVESPSDVLRFARAIERTHGIGEN